MKQKDVAIIFGSIATFTIFWVGFSLWHVYTTSTIKEPLTSQLLQIPGTFDTAVIDALKQRTTLSSQNISLTPATGSAQERTLTFPTSSESATLLSPPNTPTPISSSSAGGDI